mmetsp:Transcript_21546/g.32897  ORF Transcript_21546/g.32897 Transcript_21546/m.32897 type:complete len:393 (-) Transcript_21546:91-1269(-)|eukprot:CAMPEP_0196825698 /NCGR_PEP_ID=MMETSP1362-20130617/93209_1 /TAXON_ID=163516 /ORGANISM="Leptocylindrus danicus, Strain CCMP1856" /LENGTH=392 /DNA_ID=CAMNT_0042206179 /DNA_START=2004 /DNA_END=3182 /DNA_ORIENTATION=-
MMMKAALSLLVLAEAAHAFSLQMNGSALIVQNKGGGHGELGYQLAKKLSSDSYSSKVSSITILQDDSCNDGKEPFCSYVSDFGEKVKVIKADMSSMGDLEELKSKLGGETFDYVFDNCSKKPEGAGKAVCDAAKEWGTKVFTYVSSAGMYQPDANTEFPMVETTPVKEGAGQNLFDQYAIEIGLPLVSFRPQYIYGPKANKYDYIDWYFDRLVRDLPLPIPNDGNQMVSLTNSEDVASLLACVIDEPDAAIEQRFFNCGTDKLYSYNDVAFMCAEAAGIEKGKVQLEHFDPDDFEKTPFPFRPTNFYVAPDMAKTKLGWAGSKSSLAEDLPWYYEGYVARGGPTKSMKGKLGLDKEICFLSKTTLDDGLGSVWDKFDPLEINVSDYKPLVEG